MNRVVSLNAPAKGISFVRAIIAQAARSEAGVVREYAVHRWGEDSLAARIAGVGGFSEIAVRKAEVAAGATISGNWASVLADTESAATEFFALVRERSLIGRIAGLRQVPLRTRLLGLASGYMAAWVGEGQAVSVGSALFAEDTLPSRKCAAIAVMTRELLESEDPAAETLIRDDLVRAVVQAVDTAFIDPDNSGDTGIKPPSITNGVTPVSPTSSGLEDMQALIADFGGDLERAVLVGAPTTFANMAGADLPNIGARGGNALGVPAVPSTAIGEGLALIDPTGIAYGSGGIDIKTTSQATIEMLDSGLTGDSVNVVPGTAASTVSLFTTNSVATMAELRVNWSVVRPAVSYLGSAS